MPVEITLDNFKEEIIDSKEPVIIDFWASWCMPCKMMAPVFEDLSKDYVGKLKFAKVNTEEQQLLASEFGIMSIPTLVIVKDKTEIGRISGFGPKPALKARIDSILQEAEARAR